MVGFLLSLRFAPPTTNSACAVSSSATPPPRSWVPGLWWRRRQIGRCHSRADPGGPASSAGWSGGWNRRGPGLSRSKATDRCRICSRSERRPAASCLAAPHHCREVPSWVAADTGLAVSVGIPSGPGACEAVPRRKVAGAQVPRITEESAENDQMRHFSAGLPREVPTPPANAALLRASGEVSVALLCTSGHVRKHWAVCTSEWPTLDGVSDVEYQPECA